MRLWTSEKLCYENKHGGRWWEIRTLTRRAQLVCNTTDSLSDENKYLNRVFSKNNYNEDFIQRNTHRPTTTTKANDNATPTTTATIPHIKGISETILCILQPFNIRVAHKPITTLHQLLTNIKDRDDKLHYYIALLLSTSTYYGIGEVGWRRDGKWWIFLHFSFLRNSVTQDFELKKYRCLNVVLKYSTWPHTSKWQPKK